MSKKNVAIIGAGLQAGRRAPAIAEDADYELALTVDLVEDRARNLAARFGGRHALDWHEALDDSIEAVLVLTYPDSHAEISIAMMEAGKDVLCEKPLTRALDEAKHLVECSSRTGRVLKCGFNHRHHPAVAEAHRLFEDSAIGKPVFGRGRYGIAGRSGLENEWRSDPAIVSGGQLMEQGIHLVDLFCWFLGDMTEVTGMSSATFWPMKDNLEDNGFLLMRRQDGVAVSVHSSLTQWINLFEFEVYGEKGSISVQNLGGSYGVEKLVVSRHDETGPFANHITEFRGGDRSWQAEWDEFKAAVTSRNEPLGNGADGLRAMEIVLASYAASRAGQTQVL